MKRALLLAACIATQPALAADCWDRIPQTYFSANTVNDNNKVTRRYIRGWANNLQGIRRDKKWAISINVYWDQKSRVKQWQSPIPGRGKTRYVKVPAVFNLYHADEGIPPKTGPFWLRWEGDIIVEAGGHNNQCYITAGTLYSNQSFVPNNSLPVNYWVPHLNPSKPPQQALVDKRKIRIELPYRVPGIQTLGSNFTITAIEVTRWVKRNPSLPPPPESP